MPEILKKFFTTQGFIPYGHYCLWHPQLTWLNVVPDFSIALAHYSIAIVLFYLVWKRQDLPFNWIFLWFGAFIALCGTTRIVEIWTVCRPTYWLSILTNATTALVSLYTIFELITLIPLMLAFPSPVQLEVANRKLEIEIRERILFEENLRKSQEMLWLVMDNIPQSVFWKDRNSVYLGCNRNFARTAGIDASNEIVGKTDYDLPWKQEESDSFRECDARIMQNDLPEYQLIESQRRADGKQIWVATNKIPLHDVNGKVVGILCTYEDITERKHKEEVLQRREAELRQKTQQLELALHKLQQAQTQLVQTEKMSSLGQLVAGVAHEINNPVNFIYGNLTYLSQYTEHLLHLLHLYQQYYPLPAPTIQTQIDAIDLDFLSQDFPKVLASMKLGAERIRQIVLNLRNFSRLDEAQMKPVDIHEGIDSTLLILQNRLKPNARNNGIEVVKEYGNLPRVECYAGQLNQVFMNLLINAIDALDEYDERQKNEFTGAAAPLSYSQPHSKIIRICTSMQDNNSVVIRIIDNGPGMTEAVRQKLFDPFFTTKPIGAGTGLGLSISYQIVVEKHGGQIGCVSTPGQGAEFEIQIPIQQKATICVGTHS
jgi:two-component system NtrC family sensor kinase